MPDIKPPSHKMLDGATAASVSDAFRVPQGIPDMTFQATGATTNGSGAASITIEVSNDLIGWLPLNSSPISLTLGVAATSDGFAMSGRWTWVRAKLNSISGTGAAVTVTAGS